MRRQPLIVPAITAGPHDPRQRALHDPASGQHDEPALAGWAVDDLQGQAQPVLGMPEPTRVSVDLPDGLEGLPPAVEVAT
jgi:hypothetical protein